MEHSKEMVKLAVQALQDKKGEDVKIIDIREVSVLADYFIIASGSNGNQVQAMADNVEEMLGKAGYVSAQIEGYDSANWILMDYKDIIVHVFCREDRLFYDLERIWRDGKTIVDVNDLQKIADHVRRANQASSLACSFFHQKRNPISKISFHNFFMYTN